MSLVAEAPSMWKRAPSAELASPLLHFTLVHLHNWRVTPGDKYNKQTRLRDDWGERRWVDFKSIGR